MLPFIQDDSEDLAAQQMRERRLKAMNDALVGDNPGLMDRMQHGQMNPLDITSILGRGYDSVVSAPTRSAIAAEANGNNPLTAAYNQFGANPDNAPDFGFVGNAVADPFVLNSLGRGVAKVGASMAEHAPQLLGSEAGAIGDLEKLSPEKLKRMSMLLNRFPDGSPEAVKMADMLATTEQFGDQLPNYFRAKDLPIPLPNYFAKEAGTIGRPEPTFFQEPFSWGIEDSAKHNISKNQLANAKGPLEIHTGSDLIGRNDYRELIPFGSKVNMYLPDTIPTIGGAYNGPLPGYESMPGAKRIKAAADAIRSTGNVGVNLLKRERPSIGDLRIKDAADQRLFTNLMKKTDNPTFDDRLLARLRALEEDNPEVVRAWFKKNGLKPVE